MTDIKKIEKCEFDLGSYVLRIGDDASYNSYYAISINHKNELFNIGLQMPDTGIQPQITIFNERIIIGAYKDVYICEPNVGEPKHYEFDAPFYEFFIVDDSIIIVYELGVIALNKLFNKKWGKSFSEIIDVEKIDNNVLILKDINGKVIKLDVLTGECIV